MALYVNLPVNERRNTEDQKESCHSGVFKIYRLVGVSFGLLCILYFTLRISFWLKAVGCSNTSDNVSAINFTMISKNLTLERNQLLQEKDQLPKENKNLEVYDVQLNKENEMLKQNVSEEQNQIQELQAKTEMERDQLAKENKKLQDDNGHLNKENDILNKKVNEQQNQIRELQAKNETKRNTPCCPRGWWTYKSNCYQLSSVRNTWEYARRACVSKGARLVIVNDEAEWVVVSSFAGAVKMWIGLRGLQDAFTNIWTWTWVDANQQLNLGNPKQGCTYIYGISLARNWFMGTCFEQYYWMCEKELHTSSV